MTTTEYLKSGTSEIGLNFYGTRAPYFGRGAVRELRISLNDYKGEFWLVSTTTSKVDKGERLARSTNGGVIKATDFPLSVRQESFKRTKLPYAKHDINENEYINLSAFERLVIDTDNADDVHEEDCFGKVEQDWVQLVKDEHTPLVRHAFNLVKEEEYVPPQMRKKQEESNAESESAQ